MNTNYSSWYTMTTSIRKMFLIVAISLAAFATVNATGIPDSSDNEAILTTMGVDNGEMSFTVKYDNASGDKMEIVLKDKEGNLLFQQTLKDKKVKKTFKIEADIKAVTLTLVNLNSKVEQKFEIINHTRTIEKVIVTSSY